MTNLSPFCPTTGAIQSVLHQRIKDFPTTQVGGNETQKKGVKQPFCVLFVEGQGFYLFPKCCCGSRLHLRYPFPRLPSPHPSPPTTL